MSIAVSLAERFPTGWRCPLELTRMAENLVRMAAALTALLLGQVRHGLASMSCSAPAVSAG